MARLEQLHPSTKRKKGRQSRIRCRDSYVCSYSGTSFLQILVVSVAAVSILQEQHVQLKPVNNASAFVNHVPTLSAISQRQRIQHYHEQQIQRQKKDFMIFVSEQLQPATAWCLHKGTCNVRRSANIRRPNILRRQMTLGMDDGGTVLLSAIELETLLQQFFILSSTYGLPFVGFVCAIVVSNNIKNQQGEYRNDIEIIQKNIIQTSDNIISTNIKSNIFLTISLLSTLLIISSTFTKISSPSNNEQLSETKEPIIKTITNAKMETATSAAQQTSKSISKMFDSKDTIETDATKDNDPVLSNLIDKIMTTKTKEDTQSQDKNGITTPSSDKIKIEAVGSGVPAAIGDNNKQQTESLLSTIAGREKLKAVDIPSPVLEENTKIKSPPASVQVAGTTESLKTTPDMPNISPTLVTPEVNTQSLTTNKKVIEIIKTESPKIISTTATTTMEATDETVSNERLQQSGESSSNQQALAKVIPSTAKVVEKENKDATINSDTAFVVDNDYTTVKEDQTAKKTNRPTRNEGETSRDSTTTTIAESSKIKDNIMTPTTSTKVKEAKTDTIVTKDEKSGSKQFTTDIGSVTDGNLKQNFATTDLHIQEKEEKATHITTTETTESNKYKEEVLTRTSDAVKTDISLPSSPSSKQESKSATTASTNIDSIPFAFPNEQQVESYMSPYKVLSKKDAPTEGKESLLQLVEQYRYKVPMSDIMIEKLEEAYSQLVIMSTEFSVVLVALLTQLGTQLGVVYGILSVVLVDLFSHIDVILTELSVVLVELFTQVRIILTELSIILAEQIQLLISNVAIAINNDPYLQTIQNQILEKLSYVLNKLPFDVDVANIIPFLQGFIAGSILITIYNEGQKYLSILYTGYNFNNSTNSITDVLSWATFKNSGGNQSTNNSTTVASNNNNNKYWYNKNTPSDWPTTQSNNDEISLSTTNAWTNSIRDVDENIATSSSNTFSNNDNNNIDNNDWFKAFTPSDLPTPKSNNYDSSQNAASNTYNTNQNTERSWSNTLNDNNINNNYEWFKEYTPSDWSTPKSKDDGENIQNIANSPMSTSYKYEDKQNDAITWSNTASDNQATANSWPNGIGYINSINNINTAVSMPSSQSNIYDTTYENDDSSFPTPISDSYYDPNEDTDGVGPSIINIDAFNDKIQNWSSTNDNSNEDNFRSSVSTYNDESPEAIDTSYNRTSSDLLLVTSTQTNEVDTIVEKSKLVNETVLALAELLISKQIMTQLKKRKNIKQIPYYASQIYDNVQENRQNTIFYPCPPQEKPPIALFLKNYPRPPLHPPPMELFDKNKKTTTRQFGVEFISNLFDNKRGDNIADDEAENDGFQQGKGTTVPFNWLPNIFAKQQSADNKMQASEKSLENKEFDSITWKSPAIRFPSSPPPFDKTSFISQRMTGRVWKGSDPSSDDTVEVSASPQNQDDSLDYSFVNPSAIRTIFESDRKSNEPSEPSKTPLQNSSSSKSIAIKNILLGNIKPSDDVKNIAPIEERSQQLRSRKNPSASLTPTGSDSKNRQQFQYRPNPVVASPAKPPSSGNVQQFENKPGQKTPSTSQAPTENKFQDRRDSVVPTTVQPKNSGGANVSNPTASSTSQASSDGNVQQFQNRQYQATPSSKLPRRESGQQFQNRPKQSAPPISTAGDMNAKQEFKSSIPPIPTDSTIESGTRIENVLSQNDGEIKNDDRMRGKETIPTTPLNSFPVAIDSVPPLGVVRNTDERKPRDTKSPEDDTTFDNRATAGLGSSGPMKSPLSKSSSNGPQINILDSRPQESKQSSSDADTAKMGYTSQSSNFPPTVEFRPINAIAPNIYGITPKGRNSEYVGPTPKAEPTFSALDIYGLPVEDLQVEDATNFLVPLPLQDSEPEPPIGPSVSWHKITGELPKNSTSSNDSGEQLYKSKTPETNRDDATNNLANQYEDLSVFSVLPNMNDVYSTKPIYKSFYSREQELYEFMAPPVNQGEPQIEEPPDITSNELLDGSQIYPDNYDILKEVLSPKDIQPYKGSKADSVVMENSSSKENSMNSPIDVSSIYPDNYDILQEVIPPRNINPPFKKTAAQPQFPTSDWTETNIDYTTSQNIKGDILRPSFDLARLFIDDNSKVIDVEYQVSNCSNTVDSDITSNYQVHDSESLELSLDADIFLTVESAGGPEVKNTSTATKTFDLVNQKFTAKSDIPPAANRSESADSKLLNTSSIFIDIASLLSTKQGIGSSNDTLTANRELIETAFLNSSSATKRELSSADTTTSASNIVIDSELSSVDVALTDDKTDSNLERLNSNSTFDSELFSTNATLFFNLSNSDAAMLSNSTLTGLSETNTTIINTNNAPSADLSTPTNTSCTIESSNSTSDTDPKFSNRTVYDLYSIAALLGDKTNRTTTKEEMKSASSDIELPFATDEDSSWDDMPFQ